MTALLLWSIFFLIFILLYYGIIWFCILLIYPLHVVGNSDASIITSVQNHFNFNTNCPVIVFPSLLLSSFARYGWYTPLGNVMVWSPVSVSSVLNPWVVFCKQVATSLSVQLVVKSHHLLLEIRLFYSPTSWIGLTIAVAEFCLVWVSLCGKRTLLPLWQLGRYH